MRSTGSSSRPAPPSEAARSAACRRSSSWMSLRRVRCGVSASPFERRSRARAWRPSPTRSRAMCTFATARRPRGAALVIVMLVMAVLLLAGTTFLTLSSTEDQIAENQQASVRAFLLAEAGLHRAVAKLSADATYAGEASVSFGGGTARIVVTASSQQVCLSKDVDVVASVPLRGGDAQAQLRATVDQAIYPFQWGFFAAAGPLILAS